MKVYGLIPARGGSKGVPRKNVRDLGGHPLIAYTIKLALQSNQLDGVYVTTDDEEIAEVSAVYGAKVILRPEELASDASPMYPVAVHAIGNIDGCTESDGLCLLQPTSPFRLLADIDEPVTILKSAEAEAIVGVSDVGDGHPARMYKVHDSRLEPLDPELIAKNRQDLPKVFHRNGMVYCISIARLLQSQNFYPEGSLAYEIDRNRAINIDEELDFRYSEFLLGQGIHENAFS